jgi:hypothetical protein
MKKFEEVMKVSNEIENISVDEAKKKVKWSKRSIYRCKR